MHRKQPVFPPPLEADSLYLQLTRGCSYNRCAFCATYRDIAFSERSFDQIKSKVEKVCEKNRDNVRRVFLGDGDALVASSTLIRKVLRLFRAEFPNLEQVDIYGTPQAILNKTAKDLASFKKEGLETIYMGLESGSDPILEVLNKGVTAQEILKGTKKAKAAGLKLTTLVVLGSGGRHAWREHAKATGQLLSEVNPNTIIMLTLVLIPDTPLFKETRRGSFTLPTPVESVLELKELITALDVEQAIFKSMHKASYLKVSGILPRDKDKMLHQLERTLNNPTEELFDPGFFRGA